MRDMVRNASMWRLVFVLIGLTGCSEQEVARSELVTAEAAMQDEYAGRDGKVEAAAHIKAGKPLQLYSRHVAAFIPTMESPGLKLCSLTYSQTDIFTSLPQEADFVEWDDGKSQAEVQRGYSASRFAWDYNREMYRQRTSELKELCPKVELQPER